MLPRQVHREEGVHAGGAEGCPYRLTPSRVPATFVGIHSKAREHRQFPHLVATQGFLSQPGTIEALVSVFPNLSLLNNTVINT